MVGAKRGLRGCCALCVKSLVLFSLFSILLRGCNRGRWNLTVSAEKGDVFYREKLLTMAAPWVATCWLLLHVVSRGSSLKVRDQNWLPTSAVPTFFFSFFWKKTSLLENHLKSKIGISPTLFFLSPFPPLMKFNEVGLAWWVHELYSTHPPTRGQTYKRRRPTNRWATFLYTFSRPMTTHH